MKYLKSVVVILVLSVSVWALPPQIEADRLGLAAKTAMDAKDYKTAVEKLEAMQKLGVKLPDTFSYHYGVALFETGSYGESLKMFDTYLTQGGQGAKFYKESLEWLNTIDAAIQRRNKANEAARIAAEAEKAKNLQLYEKKLKQYNDDVAHYDERVKKAKQNYEESSMYQRECGNKCSEKYGGFFGNGVKNMECQQWCYRYEVKEEYVSKPTKPKALNFY